MYKGLCQSIYIYFFKWLEFILKDWNIGRTSGPASSNSRPIRACVSIVTRRQILQSFSTSATTAYSAVQCNKKTKAKTPLSDVTAALIKLSHVTKLSRKRRTITTATNHSVKLAAFKVQSRCQMDTQFFSRWLTFFLLKLYYQPWSRRKRKVEIH